MNKLIEFYALFPVVMIMTGCAGFFGNADPPMPTVSNVDLTRYAGTWYEVARLDHRFERELTNVTARYTIQPNGEIEVVNAGYKESPDGKFSTITGKAWVPDPAEPGHLKVSFFLWFSSAYNIVALDPDYQYAMITGANLKYLWILAREPKLDDATYQRLVKSAADSGFRTDGLIKVIQRWE